MTATERKEGFYWVKHNGVWEIAHWVEWITEHNWEICGDPNFYQDNEFEEIDEEEIVRLKRFK